jgi:hypothetical protein
MVVVIMGFFFFVNMNVANDHMIGSPKSLELAMILIRIPLTICSLIIWIYCLRFWYRNDRYSKSGIWLWFLNWLYVPYYFQRVIVNRERDLENTIKREPVLGNTIHIEREEDE